MEMRIFPSIISSVIIGIMYPYVYYCIALSIEFIGRLFVRYIL